MTNLAKYALVALDVPLFTALTYRVPPQLAQHLEVGHLVQVPFRNRSKTGLLVGLTNELDDPELEPKLKSVVDVLDPEPLLSETDVRFLNFVADYYYSPIGEVVKMAVPSAVRVEGMKHYRLADKPPDAADLDEALRPVVDALSQGEEVAIKELREKFSDLTYHRLSELEKQRFVEVSYQEKKGLKPKTDFFYEVVRKPEPDERLGKNQEVLVEHLVECEEAVPRSELREIVSSAYSSLKSLEKRGILRSEEREIYRDPFAEATVTPPGNFELTQDQARAVNAIAKARQAGRFEGFVLHGVTGSGKTEVYVRVIKETLQAGRRGLVLLPEIALTPQFVATFRGHFGDRIAVLHSGLSPAEKFDQWRRIKRDEVDIVIGARSAIFAPVRDLGVIVVDEEHDTSFKQERGPRYNARDMALVRAKLEGAQVLLGSATPILESYHNARTERLTYLPMPDRVADRPLPEVEVVDMRRDGGAESDRSDVLSRQLLNAIDDTLRAEKQAILFLNRRGYSPCVVCDSCGHLFQCPNCDVSLTYHRRMEALRCHHCDFSLRMPEKCPDCEHDGIGRKGTGTEKLQSHLTELFPRARIARLDRDTSKGRGLRRLLRKFRNREIDILVGTQMVTKGHDFPHVTLVGVVLADMSLNFPDFRAAERTFQLLTQVAGRAGRADTPGKVFVQTYLPEHYSLTTAQRHDFETFAERELKSRQAPVYPPFAHLIAIKFEGASEGATIQAARRYATAARRLFKAEERFGKSIAMLGPAMAPIARIKNRSRWQLLLKSRNRKVLRHFAARMLELAGHFEVGGNSRVRVIVDVDPISML